MWVLTSLGTKTVGAIMVALVIQTVFGEVSHYGYQGSDAVGLVPAVGALA